MIQEIDPDVFEQMKRIAGDPVGRTKLIASLGDIFDLPSLGVLSFMSVPNHVPKKVKKIWFTGVVPGVVIVDGQDFDPRLYGVLSHGNGLALCSLVPFEERGTINLNIWTDPVTELSGKVYEPDCSATITWSIVVGDGLVEGKLAIHQDQWRELEPWLRKYLPPMPRPALIKAQISEPALLAD